MSTVLRLLSKYSIYSDYLPQRNVHTLELFFNFSNYLQSLVLPIVVLVFVEEMSVTTPMNKKTRMNGTSFFFAKFLNLSDSIIVL